MHKLYVGVLFIILSLVGSVASGQTATAASQTLVISQVQVGNAISASNELIEIYNTSDTPVDITNWCLYYASGGSLTNGSKLSCFTTASPREYVLLPAHNYALAVSAQYISSSPGMSADVLFSATLSGTSGHIRLLDAQNGVVDNVGWGQALSAEGGLSAATPAVGTVLSRKIIDGAHYQDTDNNSADFQLATPRQTYSSGSLYEIQDMCTNLIGIQTAVPAGYVGEVDGICSPPPVDVCSNIDGVQTSLPPNYLFDSEERCQADQCLNIQGLQQIVSDGMDVDTLGVCTPHDECTNLPGLQPRIPVSFIQLGDGSCHFSVLSPIITELLPNVSGDDANNEFIEVYNPNPVAVDLTYFRLAVGQTFENIYPFPVKTSIAPYSYIVFYNREIPFTLLNTSSRVGLLLADGEMMNQTDSYFSPGDDKTWALIDGNWQYSNQPTPAAENQSDTVATTNTSLPGSSLQPCAINQYRSPETNRCRSILLAGSTLTPCKDGQYRSEETNRCRTLIVAATVKMCAEDQFRNPLSGRCKKIVSAEELAVSDCGEGRERNPVTNRCRNIQASAIPEAAFAVETVKEAGKAFVGWWVLGGMTLLAIGYAGWEWRQEIKQFVVSVSSRISSGK